MSWKNRKGQLDERSGESEIEVMEGLQHGQGGLKDRIDPHFEMLRVNMCSRCRDCINKS